MVPEAVPATGITEFVRKLVLFDDRRCMKQEGRRSAQQLVVVNYGVEGGKHDEYREQSQATHRSGDDRLQGDRTTDYGQALRKPEQNDLAHMDG